MMTVDPGGRTSHFNAVFTKHDFLNDLGAKLDITPPVIFPIPPPDCRALLNKITEFC